MKKVNLIIFFLASYIGFSNAAVIISGNSLVCSGAQNELYTSSGSLVGGGTIEKIKWSLTSGGTFVESGTSIHEIFPIFGFPLSTPSQASINWGSVNINTTVFIEYTVKVTLGQITYTTTISDSHDVQVGIITNPSITVCPSYLCTNNSNSYTVSTSSPLPIGAQSYDWTVTNATKSGSGSSITVTCLSGNNNNIVVTLKFKNTTCNTFSAAATKTILRTSTPPSAPSVSIQRVGSSCMYRATANASTASGYFWSLTGPPAGTGTGGSNTFLLGECFSTCTFTVYCKAQNDCGVSSSTQKTQTVTPPGNCAAFILKPNEDGNKGSEDLETKSLLAETIGELNSFSISPNPTQNSFKITTPQVDQSINIYVFNYNGQLVLNKQILSGQNTLDIDVSNLSNGLYFVKATSQDGYSINQMSKLEVVR
jgi:Secretion system C-terminal sorting domain